METAVSCAKHSNKANTTVLHRAVLQNRIKAAKNLISKGASVNVRNRNKETPLHLAARYNRVEIARLLIESGASVFARDGRREEPLHIAAKYGHQETVTVLLQYDCNLLAKNREKQTPLDLAKRYGHVDLQKKLEIRPKDSVDRELHILGTAIHAAKRCPSSRKTLLHISAEVGSITAVGILIKDGSNLDARDKYGNTALHAAALSGKVVKGIDRLSNTLYNIKWLHKKRNDKSDRKYIEIVDMLIENGAKVNACNSNHLTPLYFATASGCKDMVKLLLDRGADLRACEGLCSNQQSWDYSEVLGSIFEMLGVKDIVDTKNGEYPLHCAAIRGDVNVIELLLEYGADIYARNHSDETVFHCAAKCGHADVAEFFLEKFTFRATRFEARNRDVKSIHFETEQFDCRVDTEEENSNILDVDDIISIMSDSEGGNLDIWADHNISKNIVALLLKNNMVQQLTTKNNGTVLHCLAVNIRSERGVGLFENFVMSGEFDINALDRESNTPLQNLVSSCNCEKSCSSTYGIKDIPFVFSNMSNKAVLKRPKRRSDIKKYTDKAIRLLLVNKAHVNQQNYLGITPLMMASEKGCFHVVKILLDSSKNGGSRVDPNIQDMHGETALMKASRKQHLEVVKLLVQNGASITLRDSRGFTTLHVTVFRGSISDEENKRFEQKTSKQEIEILKLLSEACEDARNTVDFFGNTVLDLWMKYSSDISPNTMHIFKERGCNFKTFDLMKEISFYMKEQLLCGFVLFEQETREMIYKLRDLKSSFNDKNSKNQSDLMLETVSPITYVLSLLIRSPLLIYLNPDDLLRFLKNEIDTKRTVLHYECMRPKEETNVAISILIPLKYLIYWCGVNSLDVYGRTPLYYINAESMYDWLLKEGANENQKDIFGYSAKDIHQARLQSINRKSGNMKIFVESLRTLENSFEQAFSKEKERHRGRLYITSWHIKKQSRMRELGAEKPTCNLAWTIWKEGQFAYRHLAFKQLIHEVTIFVNALTNSIKSRDSRFECKPILVGSAIEETKINQPDDFDFNLILTKLSKVCKVVESPDAPNGLVHLKKERNSIESIEFGSDEKFDELFNSDGYLLCGEVMSRFKAILYQCLAAIPRHHLFEWNVIRDFDSSLSRNESREQLYIGLRLNMIQPVKGLILDEMKIDIVPCIHVDSWWPKAAINDIDEDLKTVGCNLVFVLPKSNDPWVAVPNPYAKISFAVLESRVTNKSSVALKAAYMVAKHVVGKHEQYIVKTALLHCTEAIESNAWRPELQSFDDITEEDLDFAVRKLMWCYLEFHRQGFYPSCFMPCCLTPLLNSDAESILRVVINYLLLCHYVTETKFQISSPREHFDRKSFLEKLSCRSKSKTTLYYRV